TLSTQKNALHVHIGSIGLNSSDVQDFVLKMSHAWSTLFSTYNNQPFFFSSYFSKTQPSQFGSGMNLIFD
ncbi:hypothetical protein Q8G40_28560, partial [Klebsiella pneumoniae]|uniref:hypothetical protein n=1 Tax=Klebsiella pneumoniae TaxID=573 RepID=UPI0030134E31